MGEARLYEFSFSSRLVEGDAALQIARQSWRGNLRDGVTGVMRLAGGRLEQTVEGPGDTILALAARILSDPRHGEIAVCAFGPIVARRFDAWRAEGVEPVAPPARGRSRRRPLRLIVGAAAPAAAAAARDTAGSACGAGA